MKKLELNAALKSESIAKLRYDTWDINASVFKQLNNPVSMRNSKARVPAKQNQILHFLKV